MRNYRKARMFFCLIASVFFLGTAFAQTQEVLKSEIYSKIKCCPCKEQFETCVCPEAKEMKAYMEALLEAGIPKEEIFYKVAKKYSLNVIINDALRGTIEKRLIREAGNLRPQIVIKPASFNFGVVSKKQGQINKIFEVSNKGKSELIITSIRTSCPCVFVSFKIDKNKSPYFSTKGSPADSEFIIKPGKSAQLEIMIDLTSSSIKIGKATRAVFLKSNDPVHPDITVMVEVEVKD